MEERDEGTAAKVAVTTTSVFIRGGAGEGTVSFERELSRDSITAPTFAAILGSSKCPASSSACFDTKLIVVVGSAPQLGLKLTAGITLLRATSVSVDSMGGVLQRSILLGNSTAVKLVGLFAKSRIVDIHSPDGMAIIRVDINLGSWDGAVQSSSFGSASGDENTLSKIDTIDGGNNAAGADRRLGDSDGQGSGVGTTIVTDSESKTPRSLLQDFTKCESGIGVKRNPAAVDTLKLNASLWRIGSGCKNIGDLVSTRRVDPKVDFVCTRGCSQKIDANVGLSVASNGGWEIVEGERTDLPVITINLWADPRAGRRLSGELVARDSQGAITVVGKNELLVCSCGG